MLELKLNLVLCPLEDHVTDKGNSLIYVRVTPGENISVSVALCARRQACCLTHREIILI